MSTIEEGLFTYITGHASLSPLIGTRLYPELLPQNATYPAITYQRISTRDIMAHDGPGDLDRARFQFDCYSDADSKTTCLSLARTLKTVLNGHRGPLGSAAVHHCFFENMQDNQATRPNVWRITLDFMIQYKLT